MTSAIAQTLTLRTTPGSIVRASISIAQLRAVALVVILAAAALTRTAHLATYGFSEDEMNKVHAVDEYRHGRFGANAEHPMLMKLADWGAVSAARSWNSHPWLAAHAAIQPEAAIRLPNALAGAATTLVLSTTVELLFGLPSAIAASALWALDVNAIAISRIGKEDTFLFKLDVAHLDQIPIQTREAHDFVHSGDLVLYRKR